MSAPEMPVGPVLAVYLTSRGFGWVIAGSPLSLIDWSLVYARSEKNLRCVRRFEQLLDRFKPDVVVVEEASAKVFRSLRVRELHRLIVSSARLRFIDVAIYGSEQLERCFAAAGARSRDEIAEVVAQQFPELAYRLPRRRAAWEGSDRRMALFAAAALVLTHFHVGSEEIGRGMMRPD